MPAAGPFQHLLRAAVTTGYLIDCSASGGLGAVNMFARVAVWVKLSPTVDTTPPGGTPDPGAGNPAPGWTHLFAGERLIWNANEGILAPDEPKRSTAKVQTIHIWCEAAAGEVNTVGN